MRGGGFGPWTLLEKTATIMSFMCHNALTRGDEDQAIELLHHVSTLSFDRPISNSGLLTLLHCLEVLLGAPAE